jgi:nitroreductase
MSDELPTIPLDFERLPKERMRERAKAFFERMNRRRSVRAFSDEPIPMDVVREAVRTASTAPSGANKQPWTFVVVTDPDLKSRIRAAAEEEEQRFYEERATDEWLEDLAHLGTDDEKPYIEAAPALIAVFAQRRAPDGGGHYYVKESVGLACGLLIAALHNAGLATLTHTPSPMKFLAEILERPDHEKAYLLMPVGYPAEGCEVPDIDRKSLDDVLVER